MSTLHKLMVITGSAGVLCAALLAGQAGATATAYGGQADNNTSTCVLGSATSPTDCVATFAGQTDTVTPNVETSLFDPPGGNVSTSDVHGLLYSGNTTKVFVNLMLGFCTKSDGGTPPRCSNNVITQYTSNDTATVDAQLRDIHQRGFNGMVMSWYGPGSGPNAATLKFQSEIKNQGYCPLGAQLCQLMYVVMYNGDTLKYPVTATGISGTSGNACATTLSGTDTENCVLARMRNDFCYLNGYHFGNNAYQKYNLNNTGNHPILEFFLDEHGLFPNLPATGAAPSWADVWANLRSWSNDLSTNCAIAPYNGHNGPPLFVFEGGGGFTHANSDGAFGWVQPTTDQDNLRIQPASTGGTVANFYSVAAGYAASKLVWGTAYKGFNSSQSAWGAGRVIDQRCGQTWLQSMAAAGSYFSPSQQLPFLQVATWNDYNEGTSLEDGIDNCYQVWATLPGGSTLSWNLSYSSTFADASTIAGYAVYDSTDGGTSYTQVASLPATAWSYDLSGLPAGSNQVFVKMLGQPSIRNQFSNVVTYTH